MARAHAYRVLQNPDGSVLTGVSVSIIEDATTSLLSDTLYTTEVGSGVLANPYLTPDGKIEFYLDVPRRFRLSYTPPGAGSPVVETVDASPNTNNLVSATAPLVVTNTPVEGDVLHGNSDGVSATWGPPTAPLTGPSGAGETADNPATQTFLKDGSNAVWRLTIDSTGHLTTTPYP